MKGSVGKVWKGYKVVENYDLIPKTIVRGIIEFIPTSKSTGRDGYTDCNWFKVFLIDEDKKIIYPLGEHDGIIIENRNLVQIKYCRIHNAFSLAFNKLELKHNGVTCGSNR